MCATPRAPKTLDTSALENLEKGSPSKSGSSTTFTRSVHCCRLLYDGNNTSNPAPASCSAASFSCRAFVLSANQRMSFIMGRLRPSQSRLRSLRNRVNVDDNPHQRLQLGQSSRCLADYTMDRLPSCQHARCQMGAIAAKGFSRNSCTPVLRLRPNSEQRHCLEQGSDLHWRDTIHHGVLRPNWPGIFFRSAAVRR